MLQKMEDKMKITVTGLVNISFLRRTDRQMSRECSSIWLSNLIFVRSFWWAGRIFKCLCRIVVFSLLSVSIRMTVAVSTFPCCASAASWPFEPNKTGINSQIQLYFISRDSSSVFSLKESNWIVETCHNICKAFYVSSCTTPLLYCHVNEPKK